MNLAPSFSRAGKSLQRVALDPAFTRAFRGMTAFVVPLIVAQFFNLPCEIAFAAVGAQVVALTDVRGAYRFRFVILLVVTVAITGATLLGTLAAGHLIISVLAMAALAVLAGVARHLSGDYGPGLGVVAALLFIMGLAIPSGHQPGWHHVAFALAGGLWGVALQAMIWPLRPQHALRQSVAETWLAVACVFDSLQLQPDTNEAARHVQLAQCERELREAVDRTQAILAAANTRRTSALVEHLEALRVTAARLGTRAAALHVSIELLSPHAGFARIAPSLDSLLVALTNLTHSVSITIISHRQVHLAATEIRVNRCIHLIDGLSDQMRPLPPDETAMLHETLRQLRELLSNLKASLRDTVDRGAARDGFPLRLPELGAIVSRSRLPSWFQSFSRPDPLLVRHTLRMAVMTMAAIALYQSLDIPRGYWIAFTLIVVLQPDYGSTRKKAGQRILGTLAGSALASAFLWVRMPLPVLDALIAVTVFAFAYCQKQRYGLAVFFITLMLVLLTETAGPVHLDFTISRLLCNLAGGGMALLAALLFWPSWERDRFPVAMAGAMRAGETYLAAVATALAAGRAFANETLHAKRRAETANSIAAASLQRMAGEPTRHQSNIDRGSALLHGNTRITRAINALTLHLQEGIPIESNEPAAWVEKIRTLLTSLARAVESDYPAPEEVSAQINALDTLTAAGNDTRTRLINTQLAKIGTEIRAMVLAMNRGE